MVKLIFLALIQCLIGFSYAHTIQIESSDVSKKDKDTAVGLVGPLSVPTPRAELPPPPSYSSTSTPYDPDSYCGSNDTCFRAIGQESQDKTIIICTKGFQRGQRKEICGPNSKGKWASGCGLTHAFAYHYDYRDAGNLACK